MCNLSKLLGFWSAIKNASFCGALIISSHMITSSILTRTWASSFGSALHAHLLQSFVLKDPLQYHVRSITTGVLQLVCFKLFITFEKKLMNKVTPLKQNLLDRFKPSCPHHLQEEFVSAVITLSTEDNPGP